MQLNRLHSKLASCMLDQVLLDNVSYRATISILVSKVIIKETLLREYAAKETNSLEDGFGWKIVQL